MPLVQVTLVEGRSPEQRAALIREVTAAVVRTTAMAPERVRVVLYEVAAEDWGVGGVTKAAGA